MIYHVRCYISYYAAKVGNPRLRTWVVINLEMTHSSIYFPDGYESMSLWVYEPLFLEFHHYLRHHLGQPPYFSCTTCPQCWLSCEWRGFPAAASPSQHPRRSPSETRLAGTAPCRFAAAWGPSIESPGSPASACTRQGMTGATKGPKPASTVTVHSIGILRWVEGFNLTPTEPLSQILSLSLSSAISKVPLPLSPLSRQWLETHPAVGSIVPYLSIISMLYGIL